MTTTDTPSSATPTDARRLRRSTTDRVGAGVSGGLGEYFGLDPVLFRVLFATSAFFGGAGIIAYLIAWAIIPERGTATAPVDGWLGELRRRHVPPWVVLAATGVTLWVLAFSWWAPAPLTVVAVVVAVLIVLVGRRGWRPGGAATPPPITPADTDDTDDTVGRVSLTKDAPDTAASTRTWLIEARAWYAEAAERHRAKRQRSLPLRRATLGALVGAVGVLAVVDSVTGVQIQTYFWTALGVVVAGLLIGAALRRTPWSLATLLPLLLVGCLAFAGSLTQFGDGIGQRQWRPTASSPDAYRLAFGQAVLDLRSLPADAGPRTFHLRVGAGQAKIIAASTMNLTVHADVHIGTVTDSAADGFGPHSGVEFQRTTLPPSGAVGTPITVDVELTDGQLTVADAG